MIRQAWKRIWGLTPGEATWIGAGILLLAYELWAVAYRGGHDVLTRAWRANMWRWWTWPVMAGILMGHLHGKVWQGAIGNRWSPAIFIALMVASVYRDLFVRTPLPEDFLGGWGMVALFQIGFVVGVISWVGRP